MLPATCSLNIFFSQLASPFVLILGKVDSSRHSFIKPIQSEKLCPHTARKTTESQPSFSNLFLKAHQWLASSLTPKGKMRRKERYSPLIGTIPGHALYVATLRAPCYQLLGISVWCSRFCSSMGLGVWHFWEQLMTDGSWHINTPAPLSSGGTTLRHVLQSPRVRVGLNSTFPQRSFACY